MSRQLLTAAVLAAAFAAPFAHAEEFDCRSSGGTSPYPVVLTGEHDHLRYAPDVSGLLLREFAAYAAVFDGPDDDNGDGEADLTGNPTFVAYHLIGVGPSPDGAYREPDVSIDRPQDWYRGEDLSFMWTARPGPASRTPASMTAMTVSAGFGTAGISQWPITLNGSLQRRLATHTFSGTRLRKPPNSTKALGYILRRTQPQSRTLLAMPGS